MSKSEATPATSYRPGYRASDAACSKPYVHIALLIKARKDMPDLGLSLCQAPVVLMGAFTGPDGDPTKSACVLCEECRRLYVETTGGFRVDKNGQGVMNL